ncbi:MAG: purple acid phosphatase family protein [Candidatus Bathyarchaeia archaeon]
MEGNKIKLKIITGIVLTLFLASTLIVVFNLIPLKATPSDPPIHIHLTWQNDTSTTITVTWETAGSTAGDTVLYDTVSRNGVPALYSYSASGIHYTYSGASGYIHDVELTGLTPDTVYYFICGGYTGGWSSERAVRTAPSVSSDVRFVVGGDSRSGSPDWPESRDNISKAMAKFNPSFVIHSGDMVDDGTVQSQWDSWFTDVDDQWIGENNLTIPIIPAIGNHENPNDPATKYFVQFALPGNERYYSYDWGPDIHIIVLDSESDASDASLLAWLENDLVAHANYTWKFVIFHRPPFVSGGHSPWTPARTYWVPLFDKYHVDIVFNSHSHSYQRTYPLNWTASQSEPQDYSNGTMYIVSGGWGAPLHTPIPKWYMAYQNETYHFVLVDVFQNGTLHLQAKDYQGNTFDEVTIYAWETSGRPTNKLQAKILALGNFQPSVDFSRRLMDMALPGDIIEITETRVIDLKGDFENSLLWLKEIDAPHRSQAILIVANRDDIELLRTGGYTDYFSVKAGDNSVRVFLIDPLEYATSLDFFRLYMRLVEPQQDLTVALADYGIRPRVYLINVTEAATVLWAFLGSRNPACMILKSPEGITVSENYPGIVFIKKDLPHPEVMILNPTPGIWRLTVLSYYTNPYEGYVVLIGISTANIRVVDVTDDAVYYVRQ